MKKWIPFDEAAMDSVTPEFYRLRIANQTDRKSVV